jgi:hypothetical protein
LANRLAWKRSILLNATELLTRARTILGTATKRDTVNAALAQVVALNARRQFIDDGRRGGLADAADEQLTGRAWRQ